MSRWFIGLGLLAGGWFGAGGAVAAPSGPIVCSGNDSLVLMGRVINSGKAKVAILVKDNCSVTLMRSKVFGASIAIKVTENGSIHAMSSIIRGGDVGIALLSNGSLNVGKSQIKGKKAALWLSDQAVYSDVGGNALKGGVRQHALRDVAATLAFARFMGVAKGKPPAARPGGRRPPTRRPPTRRPPARRPPKVQASPPITCAGRRRIVLRHRKIKTRGYAIKVVGDCKIRIIGCHIEAGGDGIWIAGVGRVSIVRSVIKAKGAAIRISGVGRVSAKGSRIHGGIVTSGLGRFIDRGGNQLRAR